MDNLPGLRKLGNIWKASGNSGPKWAGAALAAS